MLPRLQTLTLLLVLGVVAAASPSGAQTPTPSATPSPSPSVTPTPTETAGPTPSPTPTPSASPTPTPSASPTPSPSESDGQDPEMSLQASVAPERVSEGQSIEVTALVANTGDVTLDEVEVLIGLPVELSYIAGDPEPVRVTRGEAPGGEVVTFRMGPLVPGAQDDVSVTAQALRPTGSGGAVVQSAAYSGDIDAVDQVAVTVAGPTRSEAVGLRASAQQLLVQPGDSIDYSIIVSNPSDVIVRDLVVVDRVPREIEVFSVDFVPAVEAVQVGESNGKQDIVWVVGALRPGRSIELPWAGIASRLGDLGASNFVEARLGERREARAEVRTYLGSVAAADTDNPSFAPLKKKVVRLVPASEAAGAPAPTGTAPLPFTGGGPGGWLALGIASASLGGALLWVSRRRVPPIAVGLVMALSFAACVSDGGDEAQVKGKRIVRTPDVEEPGGGGEEEGDDEEADLPPGDESGTSAPDEEPDVSSPQPEDEVFETPPPVEMVTEVDVIEVGLNDLPIVELASREGDNAFVYRWEESSRSLLLATSEVKSEPERGVQLLTEVGEQEDSLRAEVTLHNAAPGRRLSIQGFFVHRILGPDGLVAELESHRIETVLDPDGETSAVFNYLLPAGRYRAEAFFQAD